MIGFNPIFIISLSAFILCPIYYYVLTRPSLGIETTKNVAVFFVLWLAAFTFEFYIFGPNSFVATDSDGRFLTFLYYLTHGYDGGRFSQQFAGGQDLYAMMPGLQYFSPEKLLFYLFDPWIVLLLHKIMVASLGFIGSYLLALRMVPGQRVVAVALAALFPVSHLYLQNFSVEFSTGFAAIPFTVYACVTRTRERHYYALILLAAIIMAAAPPMKVFPALLVAIVGAAILFEDVNLKKASAGFLILVIASIMNWHEVLYALSSVVEGTNRGFAAQYDIKNILYSIPKLYLFLLNVWVFSFLCIVSIIILLIKKDRFILRAIASMVWFILAYIVADSFPWHRVGLAFMNRVDNGYMRLALGAIAIPMVARTFNILVSKGGASSERNGNGASWLFRPEIAVLALAFSLLTWNKLLNAAQLVAFGGQSSRFGFAELTDQTLVPKHTFRVVTLFDVPHPNVVAGFYNFDTFDGTALLNPIRWNDYWRVVRRKPQDNRKVAGRIIPDWANWDGKAYDIDKDVRFDLLRIANVRFVLSPLPLSSPNLKVIFSPNREDIPKAPPNFYNSKVEFFWLRFRRIFDPGKHFIYELAPPLPRIFAGRSVKVVAGSVGKAAFYEQVAAFAPSHTVVVRERYDGELKKTGILQVLSYNKVTDGYDVVVYAPDGGILVVNNGYLPFWKAWADGRETEIVPANAIHMALNVPPGATKIKLRYARPLLREKVMQLMGQR